VWGIFGNNNRFPIMKTYKILLTSLLVLVSSLGFSQSVPSYVPTNGLVGWWGFNGNAQDGSGNGNHGTVNGATLTTDRFGNQNGAYNFDGVDDFIYGSMNNISSPYVTSNIFNFYIPYTRTYNFWFHADSISGNSINQHILSLFDAGIEYNGITSSPTYTSLPQYYPNWTLNQTWNMATIRVNNFSGDLFINGNHVSSLSPFIYILICCPCESIPPPPPVVFIPPFSNAYDFYFGAGRSITPTQCFALRKSGYFNGKLDDIGIWNRALTQQEITELYLSPTGVSIPNTITCLGDTSSVTISHPALNGVANASLRMTYNPDSLTYVGFNSLNPAFSGMTISGGNGSVLLVWNTSSNQTIPSGNLVNLRFRVNGNSNLNWDTTTIPCEFSDVNFNVIPQTFVSGSITQNTKKFTWNRSICEGQSFNLGNQSYTTSGTYQGRRFGTGGACDTLITLNLNVIPRQTILPSVTRCSNQPYSFNGLSLTNSGTYFDTLINSLGCDSILQLNLTVNPTYNQNQSVVICTGTTYSFGGQNLSSSGTYSHTYTTANGCDSLVQLNLSVADSVSIQSSNGSVGFCPGGSLRIGLANAIPNVTYQWTKDGSIITGANSDSLLVTQSGTYRLTVQVSPTCSVASNPLTISVLNCNRITGDLKYDNNNQTALAGVPVHLKTLLGNIVASDTTDSAGVYDMTGYNNGNYVLDANVNYVPGGINSTDALQVTRFFTSFITLSPLRAKAGDVNGNNITQSSDALLINRRITGVISAFSVGNFVNNLPSVSASGNPLIANLRVLSTGDVNGTYNPLPLAPALVLDTVYGNGNVGTAVVRFTTAGSGIYERGVCWGTSPGPTISVNKSVAGTGGFGFTHSFGGLILGTQYYVRAYARKSAGTYYSNERSFVNQILASVTTSSISNITSSGATTGGDVTSDGSSQVTARGVVYGTSTNPTLSNSFTSNGTGLGQFTSILSGLSPVTTYYVRAYVTNSVGTSYGNEVSFTTSPLPTIGSNYAGGIVFYIDGTGQHGLVCALSDQGSFRWGCYGTNISGTSTAFGTGMANTLAIVNGCSQRPIAASVCNDLVLNGYNDWYLPSRDELSLMYQNLRTQNLGSFSSIWYWNSSQYHSDNAWFVNFSNGNVSYGPSNGNYYGKSDPGQVRAVRAF